MRWLACALATTVGYLGASAAADVAAPSLAVTSPVAVASAPTAISGATLYPRLVAVRHNAALKGRLLLATLAGILQSSDDGRTWTRLRTPVDPPRAG